jgi:hypothetical protein
MGMGPSEKLDDGIFREAEQRFLLLFLEKEDFYTIS